MPEPNRSKNYFNNQKTIRQEQFDRRRNYNERPIEVNSYDTTPRSHFNNNRKRKNFNEPQSSSSKKFRNTKYDKPSVQQNKISSETIDYNRLATDVAKKVKNYEEIELDTELFIGHYEDIFTSGEVIKSFINNGLLHPKKMELIITSTRNLTKLGKC